jgi:hypothetical protein
MGCAERAVAVLSRVLGANSENISSILSSSSQAQTVSVYHHHLTCLLSCVCSPTSWGDLGSAWAASLPAFGIYCFTDLVGALTACFCLAAQAPHGCSVHLPTVSKFGLGSRIRLVVSHRISLIWLD